MVEKELVQQVFRLTGKERAEIAKAARREGIPVMSHIRRRLGLDDIGKLVNGHKFQSRAAEEFDAEDETLKPQVFLVTLKERGSLTKRAAKYGYASVAALIRDNLDLVEIKGRGREPTPKPCPRCRKLCESSEAARKHCVGVRVTQYQQREA